MGNVFEDACAASSAAVDDVYGEAWTYSPWASSDPNGRGGPDPARAELPITGAYIDLFARASAGPARKMGVKPERPGHASSRPVLDLDVGQLPYRVRAGDRVTRLKTGIIYVVAEPRPDGTGRAQLDLNVLTPR